ncbi:MAG: hypothetical protein A2427_03875 [Candidatus Nealsonbacteria bacterium RIFOXYC1_FULL_40_7]|uniref:Rod shape-determining protein RodA n=1 Tax=Candidatus Nealsonbacteria bacterium RIFOXYC1_FULL_40_7 TaxID=1801678 RepID=A0A1G2ESS0_9BACT|nr:MAG: hypothetical protein A2427_03875 [Candidatus Nealsonbacteria bacterium RIFOXYC1_FULL_40_7]OGZ29247.1 MAG: hypothetical protein A2562_04310 [Candidatus Nealsonbacteria bacterium RIFOXYD1_FULL_39_11]
MNYLINHLKRIDWKLTVSAILLSFIGLLQIYSISVGKHDFSSFYKQTGFILIGILMMLFLSFFDWRGFRDNSYFILASYLFCIILLVGLLFVPEIRGIKGWYKIGPFSLDPIGITVIVLVILLSKFFSNRHAEIYKIRHIILSGIYTVIPFSLVAVQPNLGSALMLLAVWIGILTVSGIRIKHFLLLILLGIISVSLGWSFFLKEYQKDRIIGFLSPDTEILGTNWSQTQSKIAIGSGGIWGQGFAKGSQTQNSFLTEPYTDFIFSSFAEEFGMLGIVTVVFIYLFLLWRILKTALLAESNFPRIFALGLSVFIFFEAIVNIGMNLGVLPVIGIPMPLFSYGGSNLIAIFIGLGILQSINSSK